MPSLSGPKQEKRFIAVIKKGSRIVGERLDAIVALVASFALGIAGIFGLITNGDQLAAATLLVLSVIGVALVIERSLRLSSKRELERLRNELVETSAAVKALHGGHPYHVELDNMSCDIPAADGSVAYLNRKRELVFDHNDVCSLYETSTSDGVEDEPQYEPGEKAATFTWAGETYRLISLGRPYVRGERLDFRMRRTVRNAFMKTQERVTIETRAPTRRLVMKMAWPEDRKPRTVNLLKTNAHGVRQNQDIADRLETKGGRPALTVEAHDPELGCQHTIEWVW